MNFLNNKITHKKVKHLIINSFTVMLVLLTSCAEDDSDLPNNKNPNIVTGETGTFIDARDNQTYKWVEIGDQTWMAENLNFTGNNGQIHITDAFLWLTNDSYNAWCYYDNVNNSTYGVLYQHSAALNAVPEGWHLPTLEEWDQLKTYLIDNEYSFDGIIGNDGIAKALAPHSGWDHSGIYGTIGNNDFINYQNITGFTALPGGYRTPQNFIDEGFGANWWTATSHNTVKSAAYTKRIHSGIINMTGDLVGKANGLYVRCIKN